MAIITIGFYYQISLVAEILGNPKEDISNQENVVCHSCGKSYPVTSILKHLNSPKGKCKPIKVIVKSKTLIWKASRGEMGCEFLLKRYLDS